MIRSTTSTLQGREITEYCGVVIGEAILGANTFTDLFGAVRDIVGGQAQAWEQELAKARDIGANAIVGIDIDYEVIGSRASMMMVSVSGTAVRVN